MAKARKGTAASKLAAAKALAQKKASLPVLPSVTPSMSSSALAVVAPEPLAKPSDAKKEEKKKKKSGSVDKFLNLCIKAFKHKKEKHAGKKAKRHADKEALPKEKAVVKSSAAKPPFNWEKDVVLPDDVAAVASFRAGLIALSSGWEDEHRQATINFMVKDSRNELRLCKRERFVVCTYLGRVLQSFETKVGEYNKYT